MQLSKNSSIYFLAKLGWMQRPHNTNLCAVFWHSVWGLCLAGAMVVCASILGYLLLVAPVMGLIAFFKEGLWLQDEALVGAIFDSTVIGLFAIAYAIVEWDRWASNNPEYQAKKAERAYQRHVNPGLLSTAYRGWKEKTCVMISFEDEA